MASRFVVATVAAFAAAVISATTAFGHAERQTQFPDGTGTVPTYRPMVADPHLVVCDPRRSAKRIAAMQDASLQATNEALLSECRFRTIQRALDAIRTAGTTVYLLPGVYEERPNRDDPDCATDKQLLSYEEQRACPHDQNLIGVFGDQTDDVKRACDGPLCRLQLEGTGASPDDVVITGGFDEAGDFTKLNGIRADRADGVYFKNFTIQLFEFNALYILETDGFAVDDVVGRWNDEYAFLTFAVDHGVYQDCEGYGNGDSAIYPGSASDVNSSRGEDDPLPISRWAVEIKRCRSWNNTLGYSGTAGNSVYAHDNQFFDNATGTATDSVFPNHPGLPQDHGWFEDNEVYGNNNNLYEKYVYSGECDKTPAERNYQGGTVCPVVLVPVGTGQMIAGGNFNLYRSNDVYDNWRNGFMLFGVPAAVRNEPEDGFDTSHWNEYRDNSLGLAPGGRERPNGLDIWWDDQGVGNCFEGNVSATGDVTHNGLHLLDGGGLGLPDCDQRSSVFPTVAPKDALLVPCSSYNRDTNRKPAACDWYESPPRPAG